MPYRNHHQSVLSISINGQTSFWFNMMHCIVLSLMLHNSITACIEYVHVLANRIFTLPSRCERPENQSSSHTLDVCIIRIIIIIIITLYFYDK